MKTKFRFLKWMGFTVFSMALLLGCGDDDDFSGSSGWAPESLPKGTVIGWTGYYTYRGSVKEYSEYGCSIEILDETTCQSSWSFNTGKYTYVKTGDNSAELNISVLQSVPGNSRMFIYNAILTFTGEGKYEFTGTKNVNGSLMDLHCTGAFK